MRLSEAIKDFSEWRSFKRDSKTVVRYDRCLKIFCISLNDPPVSRITIQQVLKYLAMMQTLGWQKNSITVVCLALRKLFEYLNLRGEKVLSEALIPLPRKDFKIPRVADEYSFKKLVRSIPLGNNPHNIRNLAIIHLLWDTGARNGEICSLNLSDLNLERRSAIIHTEKSRGRRPLREIFWTAKTNGYLKRWIAKRKHLMSLFKFRDSDALFVSISQCARYDVRGQRVTPGAVTEMMRRISNAAGLKPINPHSMRHHMGRMIVEKGGDVTDVANILGHSHIDSSMVYTSIFGDRLKKKVESFRA